MFPRRQGQGVEVLPWQDGRIAWPLGLGGDGCALLDVGFRLSRPWRESVRRGGDEDGNGLRGRVSCTSLGFSAVRGVTFAIAVCLQSTCRC